MKTTTNNSGTFSSSFYLYHQVLPVQELLTPSTANNTPPKQMASRSPTPEPRDHWIPQQPDDLGRSKQHRDFVLRLNAHHFIRVTIEYRQDGRVLEIKAQKYNALTDEWSAFIQYSCPIPLLRQYSQIQSVALKKETQELYAIFEFESTLAVINYGTSSMESFKMITERDSRLLNVDGIIYATNSKMVSLMSNNHKDSVLQIIPDNHVPRHRRWTRYYPHDTNNLMSMIQIPSKNVILQFRVDASKLSKYCQVTKRWTEVKTMVNSIWDGKDHCFRFKNATLTSDETQVVILATEYRPNKPSRPRIMVMNMNDSNYSFWMSDISCAAIAPPYEKIDPTLIIRTGGGLRDEKLVIGWIRRLFASSQYKSLPLPPLYLMQMIAKWYSTEMIHALERSNYSNYEGHYALRLDVIRSSLTALVAEQGGESK